MTAPNTIVGRMLEIRDSRDETVPFLRLVTGKDLWEAFSYAELLERGSQWASLYNDRGVTPGERIVIILPHSVDLYAAFVGALLGGVVPAMFAFPSAKFSAEAYFATIGQLLANADPALLITYPQLAGDLAGHAARATGLRGIVTPNELNTPRPIIDQHRGNPDDIAFLQYSSGTTGLKKGVAVSHRALLWQVDAYAKAIALRPNDIVASWLPLYHDMGLIACLMLPLTTGTPIVAMSSLDWVRRPQMLLDAIHRARATLTWLPNFAYSFLARARLDTSTLDLSSLRGVVNCSEPIQARSQDEFLARFAPMGLREESLAVCYAMAENTFAVTSGGFDQPLVTDGSTGRTVVSSGLPLPGTVVRIVSRDGSETPEGLEGEIVVRAPSLFTEYFRNPEETAAALRGGDYFTGDLGYVVDEQVFVTGRRKDMIIVAGQNVYAHDIEAIVSDVPGVRSGRCVALGFDDEESGTQRLVVLAEPFDDSVDGVSLEGQIADAVASKSDVVASDVRVVERGWLRKSSSGKLARRENLERYLSMRSTAADRSTGPDTHDSLEARVRRCVSSVIKGRASVLSPSEPLVSSGLIDSLSEAELICHIEDEFGIRVPDAILAEGDAMDSIQQLVRTVERLLAGEAGDPSILDVPASQADIAVSDPEEARPRRTHGLWTLWYRARFRRLGIRSGPGLRVLGPLVLRIEGNPANLRIGTNVTLMPMVDIKLREKGSIVLGDGVLLDTGCRLVAANDATILLGDQAALGMGSIVNAGADVVIGRHTMTGAYCSIMSSEHQFEGREPLANQGYDHAPVFIGEDVWLGSSSFVGYGSCIGRGAVVASAAIVTGDVPAFGVVAGSPARVVKFR